jgi:hypothetical protein
MFRQYAAREWFNLAKRHGFKTARSFKPKAKPANAGKQVQNTQLEHHHSSSNSRRKRLCIGPSYPQSTWRLR